ncbi:MAG: glycosyltransferase [Bacteroidales bacterium]|nr:glycosyltransferase [Bacteroidales bacterium]
MKKAVVSVINDLVTDQRVHKSCLALQKSGYEVVLIGRRLRSSIPMEEREYKCIRMRLLFERGPFFYAEYNLRLFLKLLFIRATLFFSNDLDTLLANYSAARLRGKKLIYDSHEYFTETPELVHRKNVQRVWKTIEQLIVPRLGAMITVNDSIAELFRWQYGLQVQVVRNIPPQFFPQRSSTRNELNIPEGKKILIMQGAGINVQRGAEELVEAMQYLPDHYLLLIGGGDVWEQLRKQAVRWGVDDRIQFLPRMPYQQMMDYTRHADLGLSLDKPTNMNYRLSLPNKLFDYIQAGIPVLTSKLPELERIVVKYEIGDFITDHQPDSIANAIQRMTNNGLLKTWKENVGQAAEILTWENEEKQLLQFIELYNG